MSNLDQRVGGLYPYAVVARSRRFVTTVLIIAASIVGITCNKCLAADSLRTDTGNHWWIDLGVGMGSFRTNFALASNVSFCLQDNHSLYTIRFNHVSGIPRGFPIAGPSDMREYGFMYGRTLTSNESYATISAGLGWSTEKTSRLGFPLEAALYARQLKWVGITLKLCANITPGPGPSRSYWCVTFGLLLGKIR